MGLSKMVECREIQPSMEFENNSILSTSGPSVGEVNMMSQQTKLVVRNRQRGLLQDQESRKAWEKRTYGAFYSSGDSTLLIGSNSAAGLF